MSPLTRSALIRSARTALQLLASVITVEMASRFAEAMGSRWNLGAEQATLLVGAVTLLYGFLHRQFLDPSRLPSLVDQSA